MDLFRREAEPVDPSTVRARMTLEDPDFARVREVQHDAINVLSGRRIADGLAIRREREFWERQGK
jgi:hypothetical protein